ncbi:hypothetical protein [Alicyclobacillus sp. ALC3]|uniref:hypothetical protein n=1 Tax=Alicyclobacillus sp. ALC3 TaxID=2796143 RepID=UPI00237883B8|nr:hypothetical protein [Alicyclobacillus sp. ALC3]WDL96123.1 hypothetical protein JC200_17535 [Alicyclobacillus sp. ALC3]
MASITWRKVKVASTGSLTDLRLLRTSHLTQLPLVIHRVRPAVVIAVFSVLLYGLSVTQAVSTFCASETTHEALVAQSCQYVLVTFAGMLMGTVIGPSVEGAARGLWRVLHDAPDNGYFHRSQVRLSITVLTLSSLANLLLLVHRLNQFVDAHPVLKAEILVLVYVMGVLMGAAWYVLLRRQSGWGIVASSAMSLMVVSNTLSSHSWS